MRRRRPSAPDYAFCPGGSLHGDEICAAGFASEEGRSWIDLERGLFYRRATGARETNKWQPPVRIPVRLLAHLRRWRAPGISVSAVVEIKGKPVASIKKAFARCIADAGFDHRSSAHPQAYVRDMDDAERC